MCQHKGILDIKTMKYGTSEICFFIGNSNIIVFSVVHVALCVYCENWPYLLAVKHSSETETVQYTAVLYGQYACEP